jgi:hypothetical protein
MQYLTFGSVLCMWACVLSACGDNDPLTLVATPKSGFSGMNILHEEVGKLDSNLRYAMIVQLDQGISYRVILRNTSEVKPLAPGDTAASFWTSEPMRNTGWYSDGYDFDEHQQEYHAQGAGTFHIGLDFQGCGTAAVDIYETGGKKLSSSKPISWESFCKP